MRGVRTSVRLARMSGSACRRERSPCRTAIPRSSRKVRIWLITAVRWLTRRAANAMQSLQVELLDRLGRHKAHGRPLDRFGNGFSIAEIVLVALAEGLHELRRDQLHVMAQRQQLTAEMMGADTGFHADQAGGHVGQPCLDLSAGELLAQDNGAAGIQADQVEAVLADVDPKGGNGLKRSFGHGSDPRAGRP